MVERGRLLINIKPLYIYCNCHSSVGMTYIWVRVLPVESWGNDLSIDTKHTYIRHTRDCRKHATIYWCWSHWAADWKFAWRFCNKTRTREINRIAKYIGFTVFVTNAQISMKFSQNLIMIYVLIHTQTSNNITWHEHFTLSPKLIYCNF